MKLSLFTEIQWPMGTSPSTRLSEFFDQAELADRLGFHGFWAAEIHCQPRFSLLSAPYVVLGAVAQRTREMALLPYSVRQVQQRSKGKGRDRDGVGARVTIEAGATTAFFDRTLNGKLRLARSAEAWRTRGYRWTRRLARRW